ncbi:MAG TPA: hypothetical protein VMJ32_03725 [Pirellulales bacterium]|nr:hypothetical protein [Pirellulales bacterium]
MERLGVVVSHNGTTEAAMDKGKVALDVEGVVAEAGSVGAASAVQGVEDLVAEALAGVDSAMVWAVWAAVVLAAEAVVALAVAVSVALGVALAVADLVVLGVALVEADLGVAALAAVDSAVLAAGSVVAALEEVDSAAVAQMSATCCGAWTPTETACSNRANSTIAPDSCCNAPV